MHTPRDSVSLVCIIFVSNLVLKLKLSFLFLIVSSGKSLYDSPSWSVTNCFTSRKISLGFCGSLHWGFHWGFLQVFIMTLKASGSLWRPAKSLKLREWVDFNYYLLAKYKENFTSLNKWSFSWHHFWHHFLTSLLLQDGSHGILCLFVLVFTYCGQACYNIHLIQQTFPSLIENL